MVWEFLQTSEFKYIIWAVIILVFTVLFERLLRKLLNAQVKNSSKKLRVDPTQYNFMKNSASAVIYLVGIGVAIYIVPALKTLAVSMLAGAGILAVVIGFASQQALSNIVSGVMIVIFKPFRVGDWVSLSADAKGTIEDITLRHTVIRNRENKRIIIPNSLMNDQIIENADIGDEKICRFVEFGISYDADINKAMKIMRAEVKKHPLFIDNRTSEEKKAKNDSVRVEVIGFGDSSVNLRAWAWAKGYSEGYRMHLQLNKSIKEAFDKAGVEIPFPYRTLVYKKDITPKRKK